MRNRRALIAVYALVALLLILLAVFLRAQEHALPPATPPPTLPTAPVETPPQTPPQTPPATPTPKLLPPLTEAPPEAFRGALELPIAGATGFATIQLNLRSAPSAQSQKLSSIAPGTAFRILREEGDYWLVEADAFTGYLAHQFCMINLPDVVPSIVYENTNASKSLLRTSGKTIPGITGEKLYDSRGYNERLGKDEFIMPVLYAMAKKIRVAQQNALSQGNSLKIYEAYRPYSVQQTVVRAMDKLAAQNAQVRRGIQSDLWSISWFVAQKVSYHQRGCAIDVSLVKVNGTKTRSTGAYAYTLVTDYTEYPMPTAMHELSIAAAAFAAPVASTSLTAWKSAAPAPGMTKAALELQRLLTDAGLTPLASEWWHFNDMRTYLSIRDNAGVGDTILSRMYSVAP